MYKDDNMTQFTLPMETSVLIPINDIVKTITKTEFDKFICPNNTKNKNHLHSTVKEKSM